MSTRAKAAAALASLGVIVVGWQAATANGQSVSAPSTSNTPSSNTENSAEVSKSPSAAASSSSSSSASSSSSSSSSAAGATGTFTGSTETDRYGSVTVTVTLNNGKITKVSEKVVDDGEGRSQSINSRAIPVLRQEVMSANSANVSTVSGATYTSEAYLSSLQSALDKA